MFGALTTWLRETGISDAAAVADLVISLIGFGATLYAVFKSKSAAERAARAAKAARDSIRMFETIVDFSAGIAILDEIKRLHRLDDAKHLLPERYALVRKLLIQLRHADVEMTNDQNSVVQNALANVREIEKQIDRSLRTANSSLKPSKFNSIISNDIDGLLAVLTQLKAQSNGGSS